MQATERKHKGGLWTGGQEAGEGQEEPRTVADFWFLSRNRDGGPRRKCCWPGKTKYYFLNTTLTTSHSPGGSDNRDVFSHSPGGCKSKVGRVEREQLVPAFWVSEGNLWGSSACRCITPVSVFTVTCHSPCMQVSVQTSPFHQDSRYVALGPTPK